MADSEYLAAFQQVILPVAYEVRPFLLEDSYLQKNVVILSKCLSHHFLLFLLKFLYGLCE